MKTFLCCLYVTVVNFFMELIIKRSCRFMQSVITVADKWFYINIQQWKAACFQFIGSSSMSLPEELLAKISFFSPVMMPPLLLFVSLYKITAQWFWMFFCMKCTVLSKFILSWNSEKLNLACLSLVGIRLVSASIVAFYYLYLFFLTNNYSTLEEKKSSY